MFQYHIVFVILCVLINRSVIGGLTPCKTDEYCPDNHRCIDGICDCDHSCDQNTELVNQIGYDCDHSRQCNIENSECVKKCVCMENFVASNNNRRCLQAVEFGDDCRETTQCSIKTPSSICQENKCTCPEHMHAINNSCYRNVELGGDCHVNEECWSILHSQCTNSTCVCISNYTSNCGNSKCLPIAKSIESLCEENHQCTQTLGNNAQCSNGACKCKELYQFDTKQNKCTREHLLGESCGNHDECHQPDSSVTRLECILGECKCKSDYQQIDGYCVVINTSSIILPIDIYVNLIVFYTINYLICNCL